MTPASWWVPRSTDFLRRDWDTDGVLYDLASGDTHRLGALHLELLDLLQREPHSVDSLAAVLAPDLPEHLDPAAQRQLVKAALEELASLGLIEIHAP